MEFNKEEEYKLSLLRSMPKQQLQPVQQEKILHQLRLAARVNKRDLDYSGIFRKLAVAVAICLVVFIPILLIVSHHPTKPAHTPKPIQKEHWQVSPTFDLLDRDGSIVYKNRVRGIKGKIGFLDTEFIAKDPRAGAKMFWYVWGDPDKLINKELKATATHEGTGEKFVVNETEIQGPVYGEDASALTTFKPFPKKGLWKIDVSIDGHPYGSIVVNVKAPNITTKTSQFNLSRDDVKVGLSKDISLEVKGEKKESIINVEASYIKDKNHMLSFPYIQYAPFNYSNGDTYTEYMGKLKLDKPGMWKITVLGESTIVDVKN
ncbi:hypothetical protein AN964_00915 [Heyndrickxia shackletonii]|uniref:DUF4871 domain-containing protein n=1 Tax=Heyndrickxia shackletonii TaxID=157838 RepID=A0A0Q3TF46_9BACI|nr:hypothetical protein [Heyndrickxia shackletonii]KQL52241.1 hypothetical protein AN964_00915 [Heyndrickxia shackletonii]NEZ00260.1 hypothetical protein [Heyndrickxia shackletonii]